MTSLVAIEAPSSFYKVQVNLVYAWYKTHHTPTQLIQYQSKAYYDQWARSAKASIIDFGLDHDSTKETGMKTLVIQTEMTTTLFCHLARRIMHHQQGFTFNSKLVITDLTVIVAKSEH